MEILNLKLKNIGNLKFLPNLIKHSKFKKYKNRPLKKYIQLLAADTNRDSHIRSLLRIRTLMPPGVLLLVQSAEVPSQRQQKQQMEFFVVDTSSKWWQFLSLFGLSLLLQ
jgi:hypothetical protein